MAPLDVTLWSDFLCPWCWNASLRLEALEAEFGGAIRIDWKSYLLRPEPRVGGDLERFRAYTRSWERPAADEPLAGFRTWQGDEGPPSHSVPAHVAAKAAAALGRAEGSEYRRRLFRAYFSESRDVSREPTLRALWADAGLAPEAFEKVRDPAFEARVRAEHDEALALEASGVPAVRVASSAFVLVGAQPVETYRRWFRRTLDGSAGA